MSSTSKPVTVADLQYVQPSTLASLLSDPNSAAKTAVVDVRDSDHVGGHIRGSTWVPLSQLEARIPELIRVNKEKDRIIFHCMLSQERGPTAALRYARAAAAAAPAAARQITKAKDQTSESSAEPGQSSSSSPQVCVLSGGFQAWQAQYGQDEKLTEAYAKDVWDWR